MNADKPRMARRPPWKMKTRGLCFQSNADLKADNLARLIGVDPRSSAAKAAFFRNL
jgi:hypothetical protein